MKLLTRAICALFLVSCMAHAQETEEEEDSSQFVDSSPDFSDLIIYVPKLSVSIGFRSLSGAKAKFGGHASFGGLDPNGPSSGENLNHYYHDGYVVTDTRTIVDSSGNTVPIDPDGHTNSWEYTNNSQVTNENTISGDGTYVGTGYIAMHSYAVTSDETSFTKDSKGNFGVEVVGSRQMGKLFHSRATWQITTGFSVNDLSSTADRNVDGTLITRTDYYSLDGQTPPSSGSAADVLLVNTPLERDTSEPTRIDGEIRNHYRLRGAYMTFRAGPTLVVPLFSRLSASVSVGGVLVYSGSTYSVTEIFQPDTGAEMVDGASDGASQILPGYYFDANLEWSFTDNSGLYVGAVYQNSGSYTQTIESTVASTDADSISPQASSKYTTRVDLASLQGFRAGFLLRF